jgi:Na+/H+-translocating membrane pyrophosphatase
MKRWPSSGWTHAGIAFLSALIFSALAGYIGERSALTYNIRTSPQYGETGWNSLGAFAGGLVAAFWTFPIAFVLIFVIQWLFAFEREADDMSDGNPGHNE